MKSARVGRRTAVAGVLAALMIGACSNGGSPGPAQPVNAAFPKGHYAALDSLPDWGGVWVGEGPSNDDQPKRKGAYLTAYEDQMATLARGELLSNPYSNCLPRGMPSMMALRSYPIEFIFSPGRVTMNFESWMQRRFIFTDGRPQPTDFDPTYFGYSIGRWEGDTLVVETIGLKENTVLAGAGSRHQAHGPNLKIDERMYLDPDDQDRLIVEMTMTDPDALEEPYRQHLTYRRSREMQVEEFVCAENDRNPVDENGKSLFIFK
jgi:hypothetical protein